MVLALLLVVGLVFIRVLIRAAVNLKESLILSLGLTALRFLSKYLRYHFNNCMRKAKVNKKIILCDWAYFAGREWYHVVFFPSVDFDMPHYLIPADKFDPSLPESSWRCYKVGTNIIGYIL